MTPRFHKAFHRVVLALRDHKFPRALSFLVPPDHGRISPLPRGAPVAGGGVHKCRAFLGQRRGYKWTQLARYRGSRAGELKMLCIAERPGDNRIL